ncbi:MAG: hypothetical protein OXC26_02475 [Albidovulum sp.]|nr:hypothetical protein [Albidovulum sp.]
MVKHSGQEEALRAYKNLLRSLLDRRPSGTRQRIAEALGTHKSFVSQIASSNYSVPLPAQHVPVLIKVCHLSKEEEKLFLDAYALAHPSYSPESAARKNRADSITISMPWFEDAGTRKKVKRAIQEAAETVLDLAVALEKER